MVSLTLLISITSRLHHFFFLMIRRPPRSTLLHDALPISLLQRDRAGGRRLWRARPVDLPGASRHGDLAGVAAVGVLARGGKRVPVPGSRRDDGDRRSHRDAAEEAPFGFPHRSRRARGVRDEVSRVRRWAWLAAAARCRPCGRRG